MDTPLQRRLAVRAQLVAARGNADLWRRIVQRAAKAENVLVTKSHGGTYVLSLFGRAASSSQSKEHAAINWAAQVLLRDDQPPPSGEDEDREDIVRRRAGERSW